MTELRCGSCGNWLGEAAVDLVFVEDVEKGQKSVSSLDVQRPRDLRLCKSCERVNVFVPRSDLDRRRTATVP